MRLFILALALAVPAALTGCAESAEEEATEEGAPLGDQEDVIGDGEIIDEPGEPEGNMFSNWDTNADGNLDATEFGAGMAGEDMTTYDTNGDGMVSQAEYDAYRSAHPGM
jgi:hypothetical protein